MKVYLCERAERRSVLVIGFGKCRCFRFRVLTPPSRPSTMRPAKMKLSPLCASCVRSRTSVAAGILPRRAIGAATLQRGRRYESTTAKFMPRADGFAPHHGLLADSRNVLSD